MEKLFFEVVDKDASSGNQKIEKDVENILSKCAKFVCSDIIQGKTFQLQSTFNARNKINQERKEEFNLVKIEQVFYVQ